MSCGGLFLWNRIWDLGSLRVHDLHIFFITILTRILFRLIKRLKWCCKYLFLFHKLTIFRNYNSLPAQICILSIAIIMVSSPQNLFTLTLWTSMNQPKMKWPHKFCVDKCYFLFLFLNALVHFSYFYMWNILISYTTLQTLFDYF